MLYRRVIGVLAAAALLIVAGSASAQTPFKLTGAWYQNRGPLIDIPINGVPVGCALFGANQLLGPPARSNLAFPDGAHTPAGTIPGPAELIGQPSAGCVGILNEPASPTFGNPNVGAAPSQGGIPARPAAQVIVNPGPAPKSFTVVPSGFGQARGPQTAAVAVAPTVIQLGSTFVLNGPANRTTGTGAPANDRNFRPNAHLAQAGRMGANFTWCPPGTASGVHFPACTAPGNAGTTSPGTGLNNGLVRYRAGTNAFGGTMAMTLSGNATVTIALSPSIPSGAIAHQPVAGMGFQHPGAGYAVLDIDAFGPSPGHPSHMLNFPCTNALPAQPAGCSQIFSQGPQTTPSALPSDANSNWGFPWTTGTVTVLNTETQLGTPRTTTLTAMGSDSRNAMGAGNITLVAGGTTYRIGAGQNFSALDVVTMTISPYTPGLSPAGVGFAGALIALTAGYVLRRRLF